MDPSVAQNTGVYVAPLQINKDSRQRKQSKSRSASSKSRARAKSQSSQSGQITPPPTPPQEEHESSEATTPRGNPPHTQFHHYLRAFYPYHPPYDETSSTITLPLNVGDIVLVHSVHTNGWADGTLLLSGARGWLPTNYCEAFDYEPIRPLMMALTHFWDVVRGCSDGNFAAFGNQDYMRGLIAGVRYLLEKTGCLNREAELVLMHDGLRRNRKALLSHLSILVKSAKLLQEALGGSPTPLAVEDDYLDDMVLKAFRMALRGVKFFDVWNEDVALVQSLDVPNSAHTPPAGKVSFGAAGNKQDSRQTSEVESNATRRTSSSQTTGDSKVQDRRESTNNTRPAYERSSVSYVRPGSTQLPPPTVPPTSPVQTKRTSASHRVSYSSKAAVSSNGCLASEKLSAAHDVLLGFLGSFIGQHLSTRSSTEILLTIQQSLNAGRGLLAVVEAVWDRDFRRSVRLEEARDNMYGTIAELVQAARDIFQPSSNMEHDTFEPTNEKMLADAATSCIRGAGDCVAETRFVLERIGDFEFETVGLGISAFDGVDFAAANTTTNDVEETATLRATSLPPQPKTPPPPPPSTTSLPRLDTGVALTSEEKDSDSGNLTPPSSRMSAQSLLPPLPSYATPITEYSPSQTSIHGEETAGGIDGFRSGSIVASHASSGTYVGSMRTFERASTSTRATSPDTSLAHHGGMNQSFCGSHSTLDEEAEEVEANLLQKTFAHELVFNKDGQVSGGSLPALIERLTTHDSTPDALFVSTFYLTFRLFSTPCTFAQALIDRFESVNANSTIAGPVRLRVYNVFKGWLESHWRLDCDRPALDLILPFSKHVLSVVLPAAGRRLAELADKVSSAQGPLVPRLISSIGKTNTAIGQYVSPDTPVPTPIITKSQLASLMNWKHRGTSISILDFDPLELARQMTIKESRIFNSILPEELLATEWTKKSGSMAVNVRAMSTLSTDLANLVADSILQLEDPNKRAKIIKQWVKIATKCLDLNNYESLMAIICALDSTGIRRLKRTWDCVPSKTKTTLESHKAIFESTKNHKALRQRLQMKVPPCVPFVGLYLTDLTFVDAGNQSSRQLPGSAPDESPVSVINFDKHVKTAKIISELQRFQIPYRLTEVPEMQTWMQDQLVNVRSMESRNDKTHYRRSLLLEPREIPSGPKQSMEASMRGLVWHGGSK